MLRSQLATIVMAGVNDVGGVCVGGVLGHCICTALAGELFQHFVRGFMFISVADFPEILV